jgi:methyl-accepting chemotaxis protein
MIDRLSVNALLKSVIAILSAAVIVMLALGAWGSWGRLVSVNRIAAVADASAYMFTALHNLRVDRATTVRVLQADNQTASVPAMLGQVRDAEMPALRSALVALQAAEFPERQAAIAGLGDRIKKLSALQEETVAAIGRPKAQRPAALMQDYLSESGAVIEMLDRVSAQMNRSVKLQDAFIDQLMEIKQLGWVVRNEGGESSVMVSNTLGGLKLPADAFLLYTAHVAKLETAWAALEEIASGMSLPQRLTDAIDRAKREYFTRDYFDLRTNTVKALIAGEAVNIKADDWAKMSVSKLATLIVSPRLRSMSPKTTPAASIRTQSGTSGCSWACWWRLRSRRRGSCCSSRAASPDRCERSSRRC